MVKEERVINFGPVSKMETSVVKNGGVIEAPESTDDVDVDVDAP